MDVWRSLILLSMLLAPGMALALGPPVLNPPVDLCRSAIALTEQATGVPDRLMQAIAVMESGRRNGAGKVVPWPWTINVEGVGEVFDTKQQVIAAVEAHRARGARSIDVGCMQVNLMHHADAFASLDEAFDPAANARYAARFLQRLLAQTGSWPRAVAGYHSLTPDIGDDYARKVLAIWARPELGPASSPPQPSTAVSASTPPVPVPGAIAAMPFAALPSAASARTPVPPVAGPTMTRRGLDSYRALPTRLATAGLLNRS